MICDFCSSPKVKWQYITQAPNIRIIFKGKPVIDLTNEWCACDMCSSLIEAENKIGLSTRSFLLFNPKDGERSTTEKFIIEVTLEAFWKHPHNERYKLEEARHV